MLVIMQQTAISERQLAHNFLKKLPWLTATVVIVTLVLMAFIKNNELDTAFSLRLTNDSFLGLLAFDTQSPFRRFGLPMLSSFFVHTDWSHLFSNLFWFLFVGTTFEIRKNKLHLAAALFTGHLIALAGGVIATRFFSGPTLLLGMSGGVSFLALTWLSQTQSTLRSLSVLAILSGFLLFQSAGFIFTHGIPAFSGALFGLFLRSKQ